MKKIAIVVIVLVGGGIFAGYMINSNHKATPVKDTTPTKIVSTVPVKSAKKSDIDIVGNKEVDSANASINKIDNNSKIVNAKNETINQNENSSNKIDTTSVKNSNTESESDNKNSNKIVDNKESSNKVVDNNQNSNKVVDNNQNSNKVVDNNQNSNKVVDNNQNSNKIDNNSQSGNIVSNNKIASHSSTIDNKIKVMPEVVSIKKDIDATSKERVKPEVKKSVTENSVNDNKNVSKDIISNKAEASSLVKKYYTDKYVGMNQKNWSTDVTENQTIDGKKGYLVRLYNYMNSHSNNIAWILVLPNGEMYNTESGDGPLSKIN
ncbi:hypothetical protein [uncultured Clostridium sp.]|jgi:hypothetical protein|uniref:hypothetical protein n=1 Tax=uncultured Clostridium sp. TaxID=59620 RepID=UPI00262F909F|nr:hypothetical protein [uncultured Clostridium sp.]